MIDKEKRRSGIGASESPALLLDDYYFDPYSLYMDKVNGIEMPHNNAQMLDIGLALQEPIRHMFESTTGIPSVSNEKTLVHSKHSKVLATPDAIIDGNIPLEIKNRGIFRIDEYGIPGTDEVLDSDLIQVNQQMAVMDAREAWMGVLLGGNDFRWYHIYRDDTLISMIYEAIEAFWNEHIATKTPPKPDYQSTTLSRLLREIYKGTNGETIQLDNELYEWHKVYQSAKAHKAEYSRLAEGAKNHILEAMGEASVGELPDGSRYTRKIAKRNGYKVEPFEFIDFRFKAAK